MRAFRDEISPSVSMLLEVDLIDPWLLDFKDAKCPTKLYMSKCKLIVNLLPMDLGFNMKCSAPYG